MDPILGYADLKTYKQINLRRSEALRSDNDALFGTFDSDSDDPNTVRVRVIHLLFTKVFKILQFVCFGGEALPTLRIVAKTRGDVHSGRNMPIAMILASMRTD